jgi:MtN3 and saliva related transmembrane protein
MIPQLVKVIREKNVEDISLLMLLVLISGLSLWVWYGFVKDELPIILSNSFAVLVNISLLFVI